MIAYSIIQKSQLKDLHRIDADYYQPEYLKVEQTLKSIKTVSIHELSESVVNFGAYSLCNYIVWQESGIPYLNVENIISAALSTGCGAVHPGYGHCYNGRHNW